MAVGRPREFDAEEVEDIAMKLFWEHGFDGVSVSDLTAATGVNRRSIYAEFGSKEQLFERVKRRYLAGPGGIYRRGARPADHTRGSRGDGARCGRDGLWRRAGLPTDRK